MDYAERKDIAIKLREPRDMLSVIESFLNMGGDTRMKLYLEGHDEGDKEPLQDWHPTLQQCLMRGFIKPAIVALSEDPHPDERNRSTVRMCKEILPILKEYSLPFI